MAGVVDVGAGDAADVDERVDLGWVEHQVAGPHLVDEAEELAGVDGDSPGFVPG